MDLDTNSPEKKRKLGLKIFFGLLPIIIASYQFEHVVANVNVHPPNGFHCSVMILVERQILIIAVERKNDNILGTLQNRPQCGLRLSVFSIHVDPLPGFINYIFVVYVLHLEHQTRLNARVNYRIQ